MMKQYLKSIVYLIVMTGALSATAGSYDDFFSAVRRDDGRTAARLLSLGFDPNAPDETGQPALLLALRDGNDRVAEALLQSRDLEIDRSNPAGETALMMAALRGRVEWLPRLVERGAHIERAGWTPLHYAASGGDVPTLRWLLDHGAAINARSPNGSTPLMMAAGYGSEDGTELLLARGADPRLRNDKALNAADFARRAGRDSLTLRLDKLAN